MIIIATKKDESVLAQQKIVSRKEDPSKTHLKLVTKKEEPPQAQQKMEESSQVQQKMAGKKEEPSKAQQRMVSKRDEREPSQGHQGDAVTAAAPSGPTGATGPSENMNSCGGNSPPAVLKSGPLFLSSKGIGWTSWKKRWFILTHTSLVFFRSDPNVSSQKGNEVNLTLGGIDLNNSGSVVVKADKKLITVQFQDGRDGRTFTLKAETLEDLYEWKAALEKALSQAPSSAFPEGQNGVLGNDQADAVDCSKEPGNDKQPMRSTVLHRPILLALEDVDGAPTFLEKSLRFVEEHGVKVEGILRQAADVEDVERRIREFEQGKTEFSPDEDAHVIADCVKYVIRELPSPPVPASCCNALLEACRTEPSARVNAMRMAVLDTFPEPNRRLLQRILMMMQTVASHKNENRMSSSAVAACMAPLLLRPLLSGDCEIESDFDVGGDGSMQLLKAAAAANHAQTIVITLLEQYDKIFGEGCVSHDLYSDSDETESGSEEEDDDDDESYEDDECEDDSNSAESGTGSESGHSVRDKDSESSNSTSESSKSSDDAKATKKVSSSLNVNDNSKRSEDSSTRQSPGLSAAKTPAVGNGPGHHGRHSAVWGRSSGSKKLATDSIDLPCEEEFAVESLEAEKSDLQKRLTEEIEGNTILEASLKKRKKALHEQRLALEKEVAKLEEELQRAREKMIASQGPTSLPAKFDEKIKAGLNDITQPEADIINLNENVDVLEKQLDQQPAFLSDSCNQLDPNHQSKRKDKTKGNEATTTRSRSKKMKVDKAEPEKGKKHESSSQEQSPQNQKLDDSKRDTSNTSKKSATKGEELRSQAANETAGMEKSRGSSQSAKNSDKGKGAEPTKPVKTPEKGRGPDISQ